MRQPFYAIVRWLLGLLRRWPVAISAAEIYSKRWEDRAFPGDGI